MRPRLRILGVSASPRPGSASAAALGRVLAVARRLGCETDRLDLPRMRLPFCNGDKQEPWPAYPDVRRLREAVRAAHGIVLAGPEYHGGVSGLLKNALDLLDVEHTEGRVFAAISALGGRSDSNALTQLRGAVRWLHGWMIPEQVAIPHARTAFRDGEPCDPELAERLDALGAALVRAAALLTGAAHAPLPRPPAPEPAAGGPVPAAR